MMLSEERDRLQLGYEGGYWGTGFSNSLSNKAILTNALKHILNGSLVPYPTVHMHVKNFFWS